MGRTGRWVYIPLVFWTVIILFPIFWLAETSFKDMIAISTGPNYIPWLQFQPTLRAWQSIFSGTQTVLLPLTNSVVVGLMSTTAALILGAAGAYGLSRYHFQFGRIKNNDIMMWIVSQRMMPPIVTGIAFFLILRLLGLLDTQVGLSIVYLGMNLPLTVWFMKNYFDQVPIDIEEAARIDGASPLQSLIRVVVPVSLPGLVGTFLLTFIFAWNEFLFASLLTFSHAVTLPLFIAAQQSADAIQWWSIAAIALVSIVPMIILSVFVERGLVSGLLSGSNR